MTNKAANDMKRMLFLKKLVEELKNAKPGALEALVTKEVGGPAATWMGDHSVVAVMRDINALPGLLLMGYMLAKLEADPGLRLSMQDSVDGTFTQAAATA